LSQSCKIKSQSRDWACKIVLARGAGVVFCKKWQRIMINKEGHD
jgi:hypothetical protein